MKRYLLVVTMIAAGIAGCDETVYQIQLSPRGNEIGRTLTVWQQSGDDGEVAIKVLEGAELAAVAKAYAVETPEAKAEKHTFSGTFKGTLPNDVGGAGRYARYASKMGTASVYIERFRGNDRPAEVLTASMKAADRFVEILAGWLAGEFGKDKEFGKLRKFIDTEFRKDIRNLSVYTFMAANASRVNWLKAKESQGRDRLQEEVYARVLAYFLERKYFTPDDVPVLRRAIGPNATASAKAIGRIVARIAAKAGIAGGDGKLAARIAALLADSEKSTESMWAYLEKTPEHREQLKKWKANDAGEADSKPSPLKVLQDKLSRIIHFRLNLFDDSARVEVELAASAKPVYTNGRWNADDSTVTWAAPLTKRNEETAYLPEICYAAWAEPDKKFQKKHFGRTILTDQQLINYCTWREGLSADEAKQWDALLGSLKPGKGLKPALEKFDESIDDSAAPTPARTYLKDGVGLLLEALK